MPGSPKWSLSFRFPHQNPIYASPLPLYTCDSLIKLPASDESTTFVFIAFAMGTANLFHTHQILRYTQPPTHPTPHFSTC